ncbi:MAG: DUF835 domain-containing protein [Nitrososphaerota archaeon]|nr:DUF835 domain-containing protein [Nitrososphaerota archaeon]
MSLPTVIPRIKDIGIELVRMSRDAKAKGWDTLLVSRLKDWSTKTLGVAEALLAQAREGEVSEFDIILANSKTHQEFSQALQALATELQVLSGQTWGLGNSLKGLRDTTETSSIGQMINLMNGSGEALIRLAGVLDCWWSVSSKSMFSHGDVSESVSEAETSRVISDIEDTLGKMREMRGEIPVTLAALQGNAPPSTGEDEAEARSRRPQPWEGGPLAEAQGFEPPLAFPEDHPPLVLVEQPPMATPRARQWFSVMAMKFQTVLVSRDSQAKLAKEYPGSERFSRCYWLTKMEGDDNLNPADLEVIAAHLTSELESGKGHAIAIEGLDYLVLNNTFEKALKFLHVIRDTAEKNGGHVAVLLTPERFDEKQLALLEGVGERVIPAVIVGRRRAQDLYQ